MSEVTLSYLLHAFVSHPQMSPLLAI